MKQDMYEKKIKSTVVYAALGDAFYLYDGAECHLTSAKRKASLFFLLLHINIRRNDTEHTVDDGGTDWTIISQ